MDSAWVLMIFAGLFAMSLFFSNIMLLFAIARAEENNGTVYATTVYVVSSSSSGVSNAPPVKILPFYFLIHFIHM
jgi:hypothetical protein